MRFSINPSHTILYFYIKTESQIILKSYQQIICIQTHRRAHAYLLKLNPRTFLSYTTRALSTQNIANYKSFENPLFEHRAFPHICAVEVIHHHHPHHPTLRIARARTFSANTAHTQHISQSVFAPYLWTQARTKKNACPFSP